MIKRWGFIALLLLSSPAYAAITVGNNTNSNAEAIDETNVTQHAYNFTPAAGTNKVLVLLTQVVELTDGDRPVSSATFGGTALTKVRSDEDDSGTQTEPRTEIWYLAGVTASQDEVVVNWTGNQTIAHSAVIDFSGVDQTTPFEANNGTAQASGASISVSVTTVSTNSFVVSNVCTKREDAQGPTPLNDFASATETFDVSIQPADDLNAAGGYLDMGAAAAKTIGWDDLDTTGGASDDSAMSAGALKVAAAAAAGAKAYYVID